MIGEIFQEILSRRNYPDCNKCAQCTAQFATVYSNHIVSTPLSISSINHKVSTPLSVHANSHNVSTHLSFYFISRNVSTPLFIYSISLNVSTPLSVHANSHMYLRSYPSTPAATISTPLFAAPPCHNVSLYAHIRLCRQHNVSTSLFIRSISHNASTTLFIYYISHNLSLYAHIRLCRQHNVSTPRSVFSPAPIPRPCVVHYIYIMT